MQLQLIRHATMIVSIAGRRILVDPMLGEARVMAAVPVSANRQRNPLVPLPMPVEAVVRDIDACLVSHLHFDHWDGAAAHALSKEIPLFCQPGDERRLRSRGFHAVRSINEPIQVGGVRITRTGGSHGRGLIGRAMGKVSGFVLQADGAPTLYIAGDTVWCRAVDEAIHRHHPDVIVLNTGAASFAAGDPITMTVSDITAVCREAPDASVVAVHMEAINHCHLTREQLAAALTSTGFRDRVHIPADGEILTFT